MSRRCAGVPTSTIASARMRTFELDAMLPNLVERQIVRPKCRHRLDHTRSLSLAGAPAGVMRRGATGVANRCGTRLANL